MDNFRGRVAVITGGASGIGLATAHLLAAEGMKLVLADIEEEALSAAVASFAAAGAEAVGVRTDVAKLADVQALADRTWERFGGCHVLFNNAGVAIGGPILEMTHRDWEWVLGVDLWGVIHGVEVFAPRMTAQGEGGHIINTASFAGMVPNDGLGVYCVAKYGVVALSECLYRELGPFDIGVSVLCPMRVATRIDDSERNRQEEFGGPSDEPSLGDDPDRYAGRTITADDVAVMVVDAIRERKQYVFTHPESRGFIQRRFSRIDRAFGD